MNYCEPNSATEICGALLGRSVGRGDVIGYSGQVGPGSQFSSSAPFRFKVRSAEQNVLTGEGDRYLHWVQASTFFFWQCFTMDTEFESGVLAFPYDCGDSIDPVEETSTFKY